MADDKMFVSFVCQICSQSVRLDDSLNSFSEHTSAELHLAIHSNLDVDLESQATSYDHYVPPCRLTDSGTGPNGFMILANDNEMELLSQKFKVKAALFDTLSESSNIDHPLCDECTDYLMEILDQQIEIVQEDFDDYGKYYKILQNDVNEPKLHELKKQLNDLDAEGSALLEELEALQKEERNILKIIKEQEVISKEISQEENRYWREYTRHKRESMMVEEKERSLECQLNYTNIQLEKLIKTNVFNATFHIWHKGQHFGTINNFRLGRLTSTPVDWAEINAAWGQTALLLSALARKINLTFEKYKIVPYGNHSYIEIIGEQKELPLHCSGGFKFYWDTKYDHAMVAFLECLQQFQLKVQTLEKDFSFPYRINKGKIGDKDSTFWIRIQFNSEEQWTKGLKFMITNLKWGLAWMASQFKNDEERILQSDNQ